MSGWERLMFWLAVALGVVGMVWGIATGSQFRFASGLLMVAMMGLARSLVIKINAHDEARDKTRP